MTTKTNKITNLIIVNASGSMHSMRKEAVGGLKQLFVTMRETEATNIVIDFSSTGDIRTLVNSDNIEDLKDSIAEEFKPRATTALYDAIGYGTPIYRGCFETENEAWSTCHLFFTKYNPSNIEEFDEIIKNIIFSGISGYFGLQK